MNVFIFISALSLALVDVHAATVGSGDVELGISRDNQKTNAGMGMRYTMERKASTHYALLVSKAQIGSDTGRSLVATAAHDYQYPTSFIDNDLNHSIRVISPRVSWLSQLSHRLDFDNTVDGNNDNKEDVINTSYKDTEESWSITTGPTVSYGSGLWFNSVLSAEISRAYALTYFTDESLFSLNFKKSIGHISSISMIANNICAKTDNPTIDDFCRDELSLGLETNKKDYGFALEYGQSKEKDIYTDIYSVNSYFNLNSSSSLIFTGYRLVDRVGIKDDIENTTFSAIKMGRGSRFIHERGRTHIELNARRVNSETDAETVINEDASLFYDYRLSSWLCTACRLSMSYEYSKFNPTLEQKISSIGLKKRNSKHISSEISFRRTERTDQDTLWSINYLISYSGVITKLSER
jgi:hypothetical protein